MSHTWTWEHYSKVTRVQITIDFYEYKNFLISWCICENKASHTKPWREMKFQYLTLNVRSLVSEVLEYLSVQFPQTVTAMYKDVPKYMNKVQRVT